MIDPKDKHGRERRIKVLFQNFGTHSPGSDLVESYLSALDDISTTDFFDGLRKCQADCKTWPTAAVVRGYCLGPDAGQKFNNSGHTRDASHQEFLREVAETDKAFGLDKRPPGMNRHAAYMHFLNGTDPWRVVVDSSG